LLSHIYKTINMYDEAILILHKYLEIDPEDVEVSDNLEALTIQNIKWMNQNDMKLKDVIDESKSCKKIKKIVS